MKQVEIKDKLNLTVEEASAYSGIGIHKIRELMAERECDFVLKVGTGKNLIKRSKFERYILSKEAI